MGWAATTPSRIPNASLLKGLRTSPDSSPAYAPRRKPQPVLSEGLLLGLLTEIPTSGRTERLFHTARNVSCGSRLCRNTCCFAGVTGLWVWVIYRGVFCGFVDWFGSQGLKGRDLRFPAAIRPDRGANGRRRAPMGRSSLRSAGRCP